MVRTSWLIRGSLAAFAAVLSAVGCSTSTTSTATAPAKAQNQAAAAIDFAANAAVDDTQDHGHKAGEHGGIMVSLGRDSYHVEAIVTGTGELRLYTLGNDESRVVDVGLQDLVAYIKPAGGSDSTAIEIKPQPQSGDAAGKASLFVARLPDALVGQSIDVTVPSITINDERFRLGFTTKLAEHDSPAMPGKVADEAEQALYLTPGGLYSAADIEANRNLTASQKFVGFKPAHDLNPKVGDRICPITLTKANPNCTWIIGGKNYEFCCPPCVDEFLALAKTTPALIKEPDQYVKRNLLPGAELSASLGQTESPPTITISIQGMVCAGCSAKVAGILQAVAGVKEVQVDAAKAVAVVTATSGTAPSPSDLWEAVEKSGYEPIKLVASAGTFTEKPTR